MDSSINGQMRRCAPGSSHSVVRHPESRCDRARIDRVAMHLGTVLRCCMYDERPLISKEFASTQNPAHPEVNGQIAIRSAWDTSLCAPTGPQPVVLTFNLGGLPTELRLVIWKYAVLAPQDILLESNHTSGPITGKLKASYIYGNESLGGAVLFCICHESRDIALLRYRLAFRRLEPPIFFSYRRDWITFSKMDDIKVFCRNVGTNGMLIAQSNNLRSSAARLQKVAILNITSPFSLSFSVSWIYLRNAKHIRLHVLPHYDQWWDEAAIGRFKAGIETSQMLSNLINHPNTPRAVPLIELLFGDEELGKMI